MSGGAIAALLLLGAAYWYVGVVVVFSARRWYAAPWVSWTVIAAIWPVSLYLFWRDR